jgi:lipopolysaccharide transport system permease protein
VEVETRPTDSFEARFEHIIGPETEKRLYWREMWGHRGLLKHLASRDVRVRYKQTVLGLLWGIIRPLLSVGAFTIIFGMIAELPSQGDIPYPVMVLAGILPWQLFATGVLHASASVTSNAVLVTHIYFPRMILPTAALANGAIDFIVGLGMLMVMLFVTGHAPNWRIVFVPCFAAMALLAAVGLGTWLAALNVRYRDFGYLAPFIMQLGFFISPVGFATPVVADSWQTIYSLNPMVGVIEGFRWSVLGGNAPLDMTAVGLSLLVSTVVLVSGVAFFRRAEDNFADYI